MTFREMTGGRTAHYRGCSDVFFKNNGIMADPDILYKGYTFNYWDIENALWDDFLEQTGHKDSESGNGKVEAEFDLYVQANAVNILEDCIFGKYFEEGSRSWHDRYRDEKETPELSGDRLPLTA